MFTQLFEFLYANAAIRYQQKNKCLKSNELYCHLFVKKKKIEFLPDFALVRAQILPRRTYTFHSTASTYSLLILMANHLSIRGAKISVLKISPRCTMIFFRKLQLVVTIIVVSYSHI